MTTQIAEITELFKRKLVTLFVNTSRLEFTSRYAIIQNLPEHAINSRFSQK